MAVTGAVLVITGVVHGPMVTVVVWVAHLSGAPPSQTWTDTTQLGGGEGPTGVNV